MYKKEFSLGNLSGSIFNLLKKRLQEQLVIANYELKVDVFPILNRLYDQDGVSQQTIADWFKLDRHNVSRKLDELESKGFVKRVSDPNSRRNKLIFLTEFSINNKDQIYSIVESVLDHSMKGLKKTERTLIISYLRKIKQNLE